VVNGDRYSVSTSAQQAKCFHLGPQIPFSALDAAGISPFRLDVADSREDEWHEVPDPTPEDPDHTRTEHTLGSTLIVFEDRYFLSSLDELELVRALGLGVERDLYFKEKPLRQAL